MLAGLHISTDTMKILNPAIDKAKINAFGTKNVELHSSSLRNPHQLKKQYLGKYNITAESYVILSMMFGIRFLVTILYKR